MMGITLRSHTTQLEGKQNCKGMLANWQDFLLVRCERSELDTIGLEEKGGGRGGGSWVTLCALLFSSWSRHWIMSERNVRVENEMTAAALIPISKANGQM